MLNRYFHYKDRGGSLGGEIGAGLTMLLLAVCGIFINMQVFTQLRLGSNLTTNGEILAQCWFLSMVFACVGSLLMGVVARMPLVQAGGMGLSMLLLSMYGSMTGLTYYNLLFVCFVASIVTTVLNVTPVVSTFVHRMIPKAVRKALPAAAGLLMVWIAIQLTGLFSAGDSAINAYGAGVQLPSMNDTASMFHSITLSEYNYGNDRYHPLLLVTAISVVVTVLLFCVINRRSKKPMLLSLVGGTICFFALYMLCVCYDFKTGHFTPESLFGRLWMAGGEDAMFYHLDTTLRSISFGRIFAKGKDFTAFVEAGGSMVQLFAVGILNFVLISTLNNDAVLQTAGEDIGDSSLAEGRSRMLVYACTGVANIVAPMYGCGPLMIGEASAAGTKDGAKSGLSSVVAAIGFGISTVIMVIPFFFATSYTYELEFNMYGHYGKVFEYFCRCGFAVADIVMVITGLHMAYSSLSAERKGFADTVALFATVIGTIFTGSLAVGVSVGVILYVLTKLTGKKDDEPKRISVPECVMAVIAVAEIALTIM